MPAVEVIGLTKQFVRRKGRRRVRVAALDGGAEDLLPGVGAALAVLVAIVASPLVLFGPAHVAEPHPGIAAVSFVGSGRGVMRPDASGASTSAGANAGPCSMLLGRQDAEAMKRFGSTMVIWDLKAIKPTKVLAVPGAPLEILRGDVQFEDVTFEYVAGTPVLKHVTFTAPAGSTTALTPLCRSNRLKARQRFSG